VVFKYVKNAPNIDAEFLSVKAATVVVTSEDNGSWWFVGSVREFDRHFVKQLYGQDNELNGATETERSKCVSKHISYMTLSTFMPFAWIIAAIGVHKIGSVPTGIESQAWLQQSIDMKLETAYNPPGAIQSMIGERPVNMLIRVSQYEMLKREKLKIRLDDIYKHNKMYTDFMQGIKMDYNTNTMLVDCSVYDVAINSMVKLNKNMSQEDKTGFYAYISGTLTPHNYFRTKSITTTEMSTKCSHLKFDNEKNQWWSRCRQSQEMKIARSVTCLTCYKKDRDTNPIQGLLYIVHMTEDFDFLYKDTHLNVYWKHIAYDPTRTDEILNMRERGKSESWRFKLVVEHLIRENPKLPIVVEACPAAGKSTLVKAINKDSYVDIDDCRPIKEMYDRITITYGKNWPENKDALSRSELEYPAAFEETMKANAGKVVFTHDAVDLPWLPSQRRLKIMLDVEALYHNAYTKDKNFGVTFYSDSLQANLDSDDLRAGSYRSDRIFRTMPFDLRYV
jgi:hypothetical protein